MIETIEQLNNLKVEEECFVHVVPSSYAYHPALSNISLIYYRNSVKGYVISCKHSETFSVNVEAVKSFVSKHKRVYVLDKKTHSYFLEPDNLVDVLFSVINKEGQLNHEDFKTKVQLDFENKFQSLKNANELVPVVKHYEQLENLYEYYKKYFNKEEKEEFLSKVSSAYKYVESSPIKVTKDFFDQFNVKTPELFLKNDSVYTRYNLYNQTGRPTNSFNGINFLSIPKEESYRKHLVPKGNYFIEYDFDGYHIRLIARELGYEFPKGSVHEYLGKKYFDKEVLTEEDYKNSKIITFKQIYGGPLEEYRHIKFFDLIDIFATKLEKTCHSKGYITLPSGIIIRKSKELSKYKLFNYYIQNLETVNNTVKILKLKDILAEKRTKLVLITYDAFLFDYSIEDGKELLLNIKSVLEEGGTPTKHKYGINYVL